MTSVGQEDDGQLCGDQPAGKMSYSTIMHQKMSSMIAMADRALEEGDYTHSVAVLSRAMALEPHNPELFKKRADAYFQLEDYTAAIANYKKAISLAPSEATGLASRMADAYFKSGKVLCTQNKLEDGLEAFTRASQLNPEDQECTLQRISCLLSLRRYEECLQMVQAELERGPPTPQLYIIHAKISLMFEKNAEVYETLCQALELDPSNQEALEMKARQLEEARKLRNLAVKYLLLGQREGALSKISVAIDCDPEQAEFHVLKGAILRQAGNYSRAVDELLIAVDKCGGDAGGSSVHTASCRQLVLTYNDFAVHCFKLRKHSEAIQLLNKAIEDEKTEARLYLNRGDCFYRLNNLYFALADYSQALQLSSDDWYIRCRVAVTQCELGVKEFESGNFSEADGLFSSAICNNPKVSKFYLYRARVKYELKLIGQCRHDLFHVLILEPDCDACLPLIARVFPGKKQSDLLNSPELASISTKLKMSIRESKMAEPVGTSEPPVERREREVKELVHQLGLLTVSEADDHSGTTDGSDKDILKKSCVSLISPVPSGHNLHTSGECNVTVTTTAEASEGVSTECEKVSMSDEGDGCSRCTIPPHNMEQCPMSPRNWAVLSLPLPPPLNTRGRHSERRSLPDRLASDKEKEFYRQLYYSKKDLWITRVSCAAKEHDINYSRFMNGLVKCDIQLNRKVLSELAIHEPRTFQALAEIAKRRLNDGLFSALADDVTTVTDQSNYSHSHTPPSTSHPSPSQTWLPYVTREVADGERVVMETPV